MHLAILGHGNVGGALAEHLRRVGHQVTIAAPDPASASLAQLLARCPALAVATPGAAIQSAELVLLATPYDVHEQVLLPLRQALAGKVLVDCTNPVGPGLRHGLHSQESGTERLQRLLPATPVVKAFSIYGFENFARPPAAGQGRRPAMLFCGEDAAAKAKVAPVITQLGWEAVDVGGIGQALHLEHMTLLWIRMVRAGQHSAHTLWGRVEG
jgi:hypothetical protein